MLLSVDHVVSICIITRIDHVVNTICINIFA